MSTTASTEFKYPEFAKIPKGYNFNTKGKDWTKYESEFTIRTDAVWEKYKLKDYFRLFYKCFYFNPSTNDYQLLEPEDIYTMVYESWGLEDFMTTYHGLTPTGRTQAFQTGMSPKDKVKTSAQTHFVHQDFFELCSMRFEKWNRCDLQHGEKRITYLQKTRPRAEDQDEYPCFHQFYEAQYACNDDLFDFLMELHYSKKINDLHTEDIWNIEMKRLPTYFDTPDHAGERTYTY